jgi:hypothetical protein
VARPGQTFLTDRGEVPLPPNVPWGLMYIKLSPNKIAFGGQSHDEGPPSVMCFWDGRNWSRVVNGLTGRGVWKDAETYVDDWPAGYQYVDETTGEPVPRNDVYGVKNGLNESTYIGGLQVGQINAFEGIGVFDGSKLRLIRAGYAIFVNVYRSGENVTISFIDNHKQGYIIQTTMGELRLLPEVQLVPAPPAPTPLPVHPIKESPVNVSNNIPSDQSSILKTLRAGFPTPLGARHAEFLVRAASLVGARLLAKHGGTVVTLPDGKTVSQDIIVFGQTGVDILTDGEGVAGVVWGVKDEMFTDTINPHDYPALLEQAQSGPVSTPIPGLPGPEVDMTKVSQAISEALAPLDERLNVIGLKVSEVAAQLEALLKAPAKKVSVETSRVWGHSHKIEFVV